MTRPRPVSVDDLPHGVQPDARWPASLAELADIVGARPALLLAQAYGGLVWDVPIEEPSDHDVYRLIGRREGQLFFYHYRGCRLVLPTAKPLIERIRREAIVEACRRGSISRVEAARILNSSERQVRVWVKEPRLIAAAPSQPEPDLFTDLPNLRKSA